MYVMEPYDSALDEILTKGKKKSNRTMVDTISISGMQRRYDLTEKFPVLTKRKVWPKSIWAELIWFLSGSTNNNDLIKLGAKFWSPWEDREFEKKHGLDEGDLGAIYGFQLRNQGGDYKKVRNLQKEIKNSIQELSRQLKKEKQNSNEYSSANIPSYSIVENLNFLQEEYDKVKGFDQLEYMEYTLKHEPLSRRIMFSLWNMKDLDIMKLPPCHFCFQILYDGDDGITGILTQRSADFWLGVCSNIQFYSTLTIMFASVCGYKAKEFIHNTNDSHLYLNQIDAVKEYLARPEIESPSLSIKKHSSVLDYRVDDFELLGYRPLSPIKVKPVV